MMTSRNVNKTVYEDICKLEKEQRGLARVMIAKKNDPHFQYLIGDSPLRTILDLSGISFFFLNFMIALEIIVIILIITLFFSNLLQAARGFGHCFQETRTINHMIVDTK